LNRLEILLGERADTADLVLLDERVQSFDVRQEFLAPSHGIRVHQIDHGGEGMLHVVGESQGGGLLAYKRGEGCA
jgi:hypothetical protein